MTLLHIPITGYCPAVLFFTLGRHWSDRYCRRSLHPAVCPSRTTLPLQPFHDFSYPFSGMMQSIMEQIAIQRGHARPIFARSVKLKFSIIGLGQEDTIEEITSRPEIWWHDVVYHEGDHCMKWPHSANVHIFWSRPVEGAVVLWTFCYCIISVASLVLRMVGFLGW